MTNPRMRLAAAAGSTALALSIVATPALAQDDPAETFTDFAAAFETLDLVQLPTFFCADQADALGGIGLADLTAGMPPGFDFLFDAISIDLEVGSVEVLSQSETEAVIDVDAAASVEFDVEAIMPMMMEMAESFGATEEDLAQMQADMLADVPEAETIQITGEITLVPGEDRPWVICSDLGALSGGAMMADDGMAEEDMSADDTTDEDTAQDEAEEDGE
jgi:hypothetical protein